MAAINVLSINCGSSSLKASYFSSDGTRQNFHYLLKRQGEFHHIEEVLKQLLSDLEGNKPDVVGHRFVHGGDISDNARVINSMERERLESITNLAPLHMPSNLLALDLCSAYFNVPQVACFDTSYHYTMPALVKRFPIPQPFGIRRFGFHGLNYAYIAKKLPEVIGETAYRKVVVAHLGSGASLCLIENLESVNTTMGYTPAGGIAMGTRSGDLDPGVMLALAEKYSSKELSDLVFHGMGLLALSDGESADMQALLSSNTNNAKFAVDFFCQEVRGAIGALACKAGGIDALVFTAGIGERSAIIREKICLPLGLLGFELDIKANKSSALRIESDGYKPIAIIPADEEAMIRDLCIELVKS